MGNLCSRPSTPPGNDPFSRPGQTLAAAKPVAAPDASRPTRSSIPPSAGRTLGGGPSGGGDSSGDASEARANAAVAAQKRAEASSTANKGRLGSKLAAQKAQTQNQTLNEASKSERAARDADGAAAARRWE